jgi:hypothetical protein
MSRPSWAALCSTVHAIVVWASFLAGDEISHVLVTLTHRLLFLDVCNRRLSGSR